MRPSRFPTRRGPSAVRERGFVLIVVLVLLVSLTLLVISQVRQSGLSQNIAMNSSQYIQAETAGQSVLRYCEAAVMQSIGQPESVRVTTPGVRGTDSAAWRTTDKWTASAVTFDPTAVVFPGVVNYSCMFEDATADLVPSLMANDINAESGDFASVCEVQPGMSPRLCKYRITARIVLDQGRQIFLQSEVRFAI